MVRVCTLNMRALFDDAFCYFCFVCQAPKPSPGPHKETECLPLVVMLRNRMKYALTYREVWPLSCDVWFPSMGRLALTSATLQGLWVSIYFHTLRFCFFYILYVTETD